MKIAIVGTRGIPNNYGGFEQLAECLSLGLLKRGHAVYVYNSHTHPYRESTWNGVNIIHRYDPENKIGTTGQFIYDLNCIVNTRKHQFDIILNLGYTSSSIWLKLFSKKTLLITNMDGLEWKRTKYSKVVQRFLKYAEMLAVKNSQLLVADSKYIQNYIHVKYKVMPFYIAYGAELFNEPDAHILMPYKLKPHEYNLIITRMEPENNIEMILNGINESESQTPFFVVGNTENKFGNYLRQKFKSNRYIIFIGAIYNSKILNNLRYFSNFYFHGHSVGGTNPSLLEAMGCKSFIIAHNNEFNRSVLGDDTFYFDKSTDIKNVLQNCDRQSQKTKKMIENNFDKIKLNYSWNKIIDQYEHLMLQS